MHTISVTIYITVELKTYSKYFSDTCYTEDSVTIWSCCRSGFILCTKPSNPCLLQITNSNDHTRLQELEWKPYGKQKLVHIESMHVRYYHRIQCKAQILY